MKIQKFWFRFLVTSQSVLAIILIIFFDTIQNCTKVICIHLLSFWRAMNDNPTSLPQPVLHRKSKNLPKIEGPDAINTRAIKNTENYCPRESKMKVAKCDERKICPTRLASTHLFFMSNFLIQKLFLVVKFVLKLAQTLMTTGACFILVRLL